MHAAIPTPGGVTATTDESGIAAGPLVDAEAMVVLEDGGDPEAT